MQTPRLLALALALAGAAAVHAGSWQPGDLTTYTQASWGGDPSLDPGAALLFGKYDTVYAGSFGIVSVGSPSGFTISFTDAASIIAYLPSIGAFAPLNGSALNPTATASGGFGGEVLGLELNVDFSDAGFLPGSSGLRFGDLVLGGFTPVFSPFNGLTVREFLGDMNILLGGGSTVFAIDSLGTVVQDLNSSFGGGAVNPFAVNHLFAPASTTPAPEPSTWIVGIVLVGLGCLRGRQLAVIAVAALVLSAAGNATTWQPGDLTTYTQGSWGGDPGIDPGATLLVNKYDTVYAGNFGLVTVGSSGGFTMTFTDAASVLPYQPSIGPFGPLNGSAVNPISTASGGFGGEVLGLEFNIDFSDAGFLPGASGLRFGDLVLGGFAPIFSPFNGLTVRQFLGDVNILLGGGSTIFTFDTIDGTVGALNASFSDGTPTAFAQDHLFAPVSTAPAPEPSTWMLGSGLVMLGCLRRRRIASLAVAALVLTVVANASTWQPGDLTTYTQDNWGGVPGTDAGATLLTARYDTVYAGTFGTATVGWTGGFTLTFTDADSAIAYQPAIGPFAPLTGSTLNPISTASGAFGGEVLGLEFNVDFSDAGFLPGSSGLKFGDLVLGGFTPFFSPFNGLTVRQFLGDVNVLLGGGSTAFTIAGLGTLVGDVNASFSAGNPSPFAQDHLFAPASTTPAPEPSTWMLLIGAFGILCVRRRRTKWFALAVALAGAANAATWQPGDLTTYTQASWGGDPSVDGGAALLVDRFDTVYAPTGGVIVGSPSGFTMLFTDANSVLYYLPAIGPFAALTGNALNPISTESGGFGGEVLGLELNVDLSDAGFLPGSSGLRFGDLVMGGFTPIFSPFNGVTVRQFLSDMNTVLGGGSSIFTINGLGTTVQDLNASFADGTPTPFAQDHLFVTASTTPVPEPSTWLAGIGLVWLGWLRRRRVALVLLAAAAANASTWQPGDLTTYVPASWGGLPGVDGGATLLAPNFNAIYAATGGVIVGSPSGFTMVFTDAGSVLQYLPSIGPFAPLNGSVVDPLSTASGSFGSEILGLEFNVDFSDAGLLPGSSGLRFGDLVLGGFTPIFSLLNGLTVRELLGDANILLSGGSTVFSIDSVGPLVNNLNGAFSNGIPQDFAQAHLFAPASTAPAPEPASWLMIIGGFGLLRFRRQRR
jgi:outer membrane murein-binding lipoprotein Lpp